MRRADHSFREVLPCARVCVCLIYVRSRNLNKGDLRPTWAVELHLKNKHLGVQLNSRRAQNCRNRTGTLPAFKPEGLLFPVL
jgi:hypothetical protein